MMPVRRFACAVRGERVGQARDKSRDRSSGFDALASVDAERTYYPATSGFIFATTGLIDHIHLPFYGLVALSADSGPLAIRVGSRPPQLTQYEAVACWAKNVRFDMADRKFITVGVNPLHRDFRAYTRLGSPRLLPLDASRYLHLRPLIRRAIHGGLSSVEASRLFDGVLDATREALPPVPPIDSRTEVLMRMLWENPRCSLADIADGIGVSYHRASHAFVQAVGVTTRTYQLWQKFYRASVPLLAGRPLTEVAQFAGFVDSAHFSRAFQHAYGRCPSQMFRTRRIEVFCKSSFSEAAIVHAESRRSCNERPLASLHRY
jgi:AraC-like DNA-binding protein